MPVESSHHTLGGPTARSQPQEAQRAALYIAGQAHDVDDCRELLAMLGLTAPGHRWERTSVAAGLRNRHKTTKEGLNR
jgi:hypothetical protein